MTSSLVRKPLLRALAGQRESIPPLWLMRQAGRYLPEYRALREQAVGFLDLCFDAERAAEITLQPVRRFGFDAAILFSDILVVPHALGLCGPSVSGTGANGRADSVATHRLSGGRRFRRRIRDRSGGGLFDRREHQRGWGAAPHRN